MATVNKINSPMTQAVQSYMEMRLIAGGVGAIAGGNPSTGTGHFTSNPFPSVYYYNGITGFKSGALEREQYIQSPIFQEKTFNIDPSIVDHSTLSFQSERINNVNQYEKNQIASTTDNTSMEGDV